MSADRVFQIIPRDHPEVDCWESCPTCGAKIPIPKLITREELQLRIERNAMEAYKHLHYGLGISYEISKLAVHRSDRCTPAPTATCPFCNKVLRTNTAKQCRFCHADWHNSTSAQIDSLCGTTSGAGAIREQMHREDEER